MINTKQAPRREIEFNSIDDIKADLDRLDAAHAAGNLGHTGNWTTGEVMDHLSKFWTCSLDGFPPGKPPLVMRIVAQTLLKKKATSLGSQPPPGFKIPKGVDHFTPEPGIAYEKASERLRNCISRVESGDHHVPESPLFGKLTNEQWINIHLGHCAMHLSFLDPKS